MALVRLVTWLVVRSPVQRWFRVVPSPLFANARCSRRRDHMLEIRMISRIDLAAPWREAGDDREVGKRCFPQPLERVSDRLILYDTSAVEHVLARRAERMTQWKPPRSAS